MSNTNKAAAVPKLKGTPFTAADVASARAMANLMGPLLCASDDPSDAPALLAAQANYESRRPGWCHCHDDGPADAYYRDQASGSHGWMCCICWKTTQTG